MTDISKKKVLIGAKTYIDALGLYYVDKTLFIRDILEDGADVSLITRPARFGKTLNLDMLKTFFEISYEDTSKYFIDKKIWACGDEFRRKQGTYPVIFLSLADIMGNTWTDAYNRATDLIAAEFNRHTELRNSYKVSAVNLCAYSQICSGTASRAMYEESLKILSQMLYDHHEVDPIILIDGYDAPVQAGYDNGYHKQITSFLRGVLNAGLKTNVHMSFAVMTGIQGIAYESFREDLNNVIDFSTEEMAFSEDFGFTHEEVNAMLSYYGIADKYDEVCKRCGSCKSGGTEVFNPCSVINCVKQLCSL